jgi:NIPSNAP protein
MLSQIRIYTINKGEMDNFLKHFKEEITPLHERIGVPIVGTWVNRPQNEFIWVRTYKDKADLEAKSKAFQAEVAAAGIKLGSNVAKMEVREVESPFV